MVHVVDTESLLHYLNKACLGLAIMSIPWVQFKGVGSVISIFNVDVLAIGDEFLIFWR